MSDYIERETVLRRIEEMRVKEDDYAPDVAQAIYDFVVDMDAADVTPVRHECWDDSRRWSFLDGTPAVRCTGCGACLAEEEYKKNVWNFCPVCGAKMDKTEDRA